MAEEIILTGDDLMSSLPSPVVPPDLAPRVLEGGNVDTCARELRALFHCLHVNEVEPFCQDRILVFRRCTTTRDKDLRDRLLLAELESAKSRPDPENRERLGALRSSVTSLRRQLILASSLQGPEGFQARWRLNGEANDVEARAGALETYLQQQEGQQEGKGVQSRKMFWLF